MVQKNQLRLLVANQRIVDRAGRLRNSGSSGRGIAIVFYFGIIFLQADSRYCLAIFSQLANGFDGSEGGGESG